jgi:CDP-glucose 4,6-dehydratase
MWLSELGAEIAGVSIGEPTKPCNFVILGLQEKLRHYQVDIRNREEVSKVFSEFRPEIVFHLAAQSIVRRGYEDPVLTLETNAFGTMNVLEAIRQTDSVESAVLITSDKCYRNVEWIWGYREIDSLGGEDPYSASKACAENIASTYIHSYFSDGASRIATARAGNVIGGGDWAPGRVVPDCARAWSERQSTIIRNPESTRPWQHVLEPLSGYLWLGAMLWLRDSNATGEAFNFGPSRSANESVEDLVITLGHYWPDLRWQVDSHIVESKRESSLLQLNCDKAKAMLGWRTILPFDETIAYTANWYKCYYADGDNEALAITRTQIERYSSVAHEENLAWAY